MLLNPLPLLSPAQQAHELPPKVATVADAPGYLAARVVGGDDEPELFPRTWELLEGVSSHSVSHGEPPERQLDPPTEVGFGAAQGVNWLASV